MAIPDSQQYNWNLKLIYDVEDIVVFIVKSVNSDNSCMFSCSRHAQVTLVDKSQLKITSIQIKNIKIKFILD